MAKIALLSLYDDMALGLKVIANAALSEGHEVSIIHFKLPASTILDMYKEKPTNYEYVNSKESHSKVLLHGINMDVNMWTTEEENQLGDLLQKINPDLIGLSTRSVYEDCIGRILQQMKKVSGAVTVAGGHGSNFEQNLYLEYLDLVCIGEGEKPILDIARAIDNKTEFDSIENIVYKKNGKVTHTKLSCPDPSQDHFYNKNIENVYHYVIEEEKTIKTDMFLRNITIPSYKNNDYTNLDDYFTITGWGCVDDCTFCSAGRFYRKFQEAGLSVSQRRMRKIEKVIEELKYAKKEGYKQIKFIDSYFLAPESYLSEFFDVYESEIGLPFFAQLYPKQILKSPEILERAYKAGLMHTVAGIQAGSERLNRLVFKRHLPNEDLIRYGNLLMDCGSLSYDYHVITHNPFETESDFKITLDLLGKLPSKRSALVLFRLNLVPRTEIYNMVKSGKEVCESDMNVFAKRAILLLSRFNAPNDDVFKSIEEKSKTDNFEQLKEAYAIMRATYKDSHILTLEGWDDYKEKSYSQAEANFNKAIDLDGSYWKALSGRAWTYQQTGNYLSAVKDFKQALKYTKPFTEKGRAGMQESYRGLAWALFSQEEYEMAIDNFNNSLEYTSSDTRSVLQDIYRGLGWSHVRLGQLEKGRLYFMKALEQIDSSEKELLDDAHNGLAEIDSILNKAGRV